ncbi:PAAR domain-containing protein [Methylobacterium sp. OAE515]|uniref:PAAR domain-containing protein n=1 Tax=Methylobacterium sp. OAE515 TaxID=2817895 RepID=UPI00178B9C76
MAGFPAARISDEHVCPSSTGPIPHVGGPIVQGCETVLIANLPAARQGDAATCVGPTDRIVLGSLTVFIGGKRAARVNDPCQHGGKVVQGCPTVLIG